LLALFAALFAADLAFADGAAILPLLEGARIKLLR
jgi:hypothetical protein